MDSIFLTILNMSLTGAFVIAAICLARLPLKKAPKIISYCLWAVAGFRLVFPFSIESALSLIPFRSAPIQPMLHAQQTLSVHTMPPIQHDIITQTAPNIDSGMQTIIANNDAVNNITHAATPAISTDPLQLLMTIGAYVWIAGLAIMLIYGVVSYVRLKQRMKSAIRVDDGIYETDKIQTPFVLGIIKPKVFIPFNLSIQEREYIIRHEQTHIRRCDHIIKFAAYFILCLHWFNPLTWVAFLLMGADMEMSCDERVLKEMGTETKKEYSRSLLSLSANRRMIGGSPLAFSEGGLKSRIKHVLNFKKTSKIVVAIAVMLVVALSVGLMVNGVSEEDSPEEVSGVNRYISNYDLVALSELRMTYDVDVTNQENAERFAEILSLLPRHFHNEWRLATYDECGCGNSLTMHYTIDALRMSRNGGIPDNELRNAVLLFSLIDNLERVIVSYNEDSVADWFILRIDAEQVLGIAGWDGLWDGQNLSIDAVSDALDKIVALKRRSHMPQDGFSPMTSVDRALYEEHVECTNGQEQVEPFQFQRAIIQMLPQGASTPRMGGSGDITYGPMISAWTEYDINDENYRWTLSLMQQHSSEEGSAQNWFEFWLRGHSEREGHHHVEQFVLGDAEAFVLSRFTLEQLENLGQPNLGGAEQAYEYEDYPISIILHWTHGSDFFELTATGLPGAVTWNELLTIAESVR